MVLLKLLVGRTAALFFFTELLFPFPIPLHFFTDFDPFGFKTVFPSLENLKYHCY